MPDPFRKEGLIPAPFADPRSRPRVALVRGVSAGAFLERYTAGARSMAAGLGVDLALLDAHGEAHRVASLIDEAVRGGAQAIVVGHAQPGLIRGAVEAALAQGVRVVAFDTALDHPEVPEIEQDDLLVGHLISRKLATDAGGRAEVLVVTSEAFAPLARRDRGWQSHLWRYPGIREVARIGAVSAQPAADTRAAVAELLRAQPGITAILAMWDEFAAGAARAVEDAGLAEKVAVYSVDVTDEDIQAMTRPGSPWAATVATDAFSIGRLALRAAAALLAGEPVERFLLLQPTLVTRELLTARHITRMEELVAALPSFGDSQLVWPQWMDRLLERNAADTSPSRIPDPLRAGAKSYLEKLVDSVADPIFVKDRQHRWVLLNAAFCRLMARERSELLLKSDYDFIPKAQADVFWAKDELVFTTGEENENEELLTDATGAVHVLVTKKTLHTDDDGEKYIVAVIRDVTERRRLEDQLRQSQKMETVGLLAGGVAHDFNNLLTPILGYVPQLLADLPADHAAHEALQDVLDAGERAKDLTRRLLTFSRRQLIEPRALDVRGLIRESERILRRTIRESIQIEVALPDAVGPVLADRGQLEQVLLNLAVNAQDAMPDGGRLRIAVRDAAPGELDAAPPPAASAWIRLDVSDTGAGMDPETMERVFEPFFTTKELGRGTGLGLSTVYGIVEKHGGRITVRSGKGEGTSFTIFLPRAPGEAPPAEPKPAQPEALAVAHGDETVLVVEDDEPVRTLARRILERAGYRVIVADGGERCLELLRGIAHPIDLLLTDVVMPRMNGRELVERLRETHPSLRVLYMSGYANDVIGRAGVVDDVLLLSKPFTPGTLTQRVRQVLDAP